MRKQRSFLRHVADAAFFRRRMDSGPATIRPPISTAPESARSKPQTSRSRVVLPLPEAPRTATSAPAATSISRPRRTGVPPNALRQSRDGEAGHRQVQPKNAASAQAIGEEPCHSERQAEHQRCKRRRRGEGDRRSIGPDFRRQCSRARRGEQQGRGQFGRDEDEHHRRARAETVGGQRQDDAPGDPEALSPSARAASSRPGGICDSVARTLTSASGRNRIA